MPKKSKAGAARGLHGNDREELFRDVATRRPAAGGLKMHSFLNRLGCVGLVAGVVFAFGQQVYPILAQTIDALPFGILETALTTVLGSSLYAALYG
jgi:hypothetical protein